MLAREAAVFAVAAGLALVHALDDAFVHRGPGLGLGQHAVAGAISSLAVAAAVVAFPTHRAEYEQRVGAFFDRAL